ncbi:MAG: ribosome maturation factor RimM [Muribaculum sp.]|nr:ribosome maturation factor RimM [Muribaculaceae bacterium]MCM1081034.1 ribosome maturation factor RimM [Muribaculum sp.]
MITNDELTHFGHFGKPHGINGEINLYTDYDADEINLDSLVRIIANIDGINIPFIIEGIRNKRAGNFIVSLNDINNDKDARILTNLDVFVLIADNVIITDDEDGLYAGDLVGYSLITNVGVIVGTISDVDFSTENVLLVIEKEESDAPVYIPLADEFIEEINPETKTIIMHFPDELLSLN